MPRKHSRRVLKLSRVPSGEKMFEFFFKIVHFGVIYIFERRRGPQNIAGPKVTYLLTPTSVDAPGSES